VVNIQDTMLHIILLMLQHVADWGNNRIQKFDSTGKFIATWGSSGSGNGQFRNPRSAAVDFAGNVYVVDYGNDRIQKFSSNGTFITTWGSSGSGDGSFNRPTDVAVDSAGKVYVADSGNDRIQKFCCRSPSCISLTRQPLITESFGSS
jgi:tripartite motif-containing protein 71